MSLWRSGRRLPEPEPVDRPAVHRDVVLVETAEASHLELQARLRHVARLAERVLFAQSFKPDELRDAELIDLALDIRSALRPSPPGSEVLREMPPVGIRYAVPIVPGRPS